MNVRSSTPPLDPLARRDLTIMKTLDLDKITEGCSRLWAGFLRDWDRTLRAGNHPVTTRYNYLLAAAQLGRYLAEHSPDPDADAAADDPCAVTRAHVESFQGWMIETRSASTALNKHKGLQQFFRWLVNEEEIDRSPMDRVPQPKTPKKLIPIIAEADTRRLLDQCKGRSFAALRDEALIRLYANTGARLSEVGNLNVDDLDMATESVHITGKGSRDRRVRFGPRTARALSRYLRARAQHKGAELPNLWLADRGATPLAPNGIKIRLKRLGKAAGIDGIHAQVAAHLRPRVEARRRRYRRPDAPARLDQRRHASPLRRQRRRAARPGDAATPWHRRAGVGIGTGSE
jgi:site-specific recombinase XerC